MKCLACTIAAAALLVPLAAWGGPIPPNVELITTEPEDCFDPVVSPDGRWVVYVADRQGTTDIYARRIDSPAPGAPIALAPSAAEDISPSFSPDGRWLAWVSSREDAFGDVWVMRFPSGDPMLVSERGRRDLHPHWEGSGGSMRLRYFTEGEEGAWDVVEAHRRRSFWPWSRPGRWRTETVEEGVPLPDDSDTRGRLQVLHQDDTNGDGEVSEASGDAPSLWHYDEETSTFRQLTPPFVDLNSPGRDRNGRLVFSARFRDNLAVARVAQPFRVATFQTQAEGLGLANDQWRDFPARPFEAVALARQAYLMDPGTEEGRAALLLTLDILRAADRPEQALLTLRQAGRGTEDARDFSAELLWRRAVLAIEAALREGASREELRRLREDAERAMRSIPADEGLDDDLRARAAIERARVLSTLGRRSEAIDELDGVLDRADASPNLLARTVLEKGRIYRSILPEQADSVLLSVLQDYPGEMEVMEEAAEELADGALTGVTTLDEQILALRRLTVRTGELPAIEAAARLREGTLFEQRGNVVEARLAWTEAAGFSAQAPRLAARAAFAHAENLARFGEFAEAIDLYESVDEKLRGLFFPGQPRFIEEAREGLIREFLAKGNAEMRLGDAPLALRTFNELIGREPELVEAWRGAFEARYRMGLMDRPFRRNLQREARANRNDALAQYKYGLALTYQDRIPRQAIRSIEAAIALDGSVPYFHQTLGFIYEYLGRRDEANRNAALALQEYQRALALIDADARPLDHARLIVNTANAAFTLGQHARAADLYGQRLASDLPFDDPRTEFLARRQHGIALFRSFRAAEAAEAFERSRAVLGQLREQRLVEGDEADEIETELIDRQALALMDAGSYADAVTLFEEVAARSEPETLNRARALRNIGFARLRDATVSGGPRGERLRTQAMRSFEDALEVLEASAFRADAPRTRRGALLTFDVTISSDPLGGAQLDLSREDEIRLVRTALTNIRVQRMEPTDAIRELRAQIEAQPGRAGERQPYFQTIRLVTLDQIARRRALIGNYEGAVRDLLDAIDETRFVEEDVEVVNGGALAQLLMHLTELSLSAPEPPEALRRLRRTWIGDGVAETDPLDVLDVATRRALAMRIPDKPDYLIEQAGLRNRLVLSRALLAERLALETAARGDGDTIAGLHAARAATLAEDAIANAQGEFTGPEARRLAVLAQGVLLRVTQRMEPADRWERRREAALTLAERWGHPELRWWLEAQGAFDSDDERARVAARRTLAELERNPPGLFAAHFEVPAPLLERCERLLVGAALAEDDWREGLHLAERFRSARLRLMLGGTTPSPAPADADDAEWLRDALRLRATYAQSAQGLRTLAFGEDHRPALSRMREAAVAWNRHLEQGRERLLPSALLLAPGATPMENPAAALADALALPSSPALVFRIGGRSYAWTEEGGRTLEAPEEWNALAQEASAWFLFGDALPQGIEAPESAVHVLTFESTIAALLDLRLDTGTESVPWPEADALPPVALETLPREELEFARGMQLSAPVYSGTRRDPLLWRVEGVDAPLGSVLAELPATERLRLTLARGESLARSHDREAHAQLLAALAAQSGAAEAIVDDRLWVGRMLRPREAPELAEIELAASLGLVRGRLEAGDIRGALEPARRTWFLREALERPHEDVAEAATLLAQIQGDLRRFEAAARTMRGVIESQRAEGRTADLATALLLHGSYALDALQFDDAVASYREAAALFEELGEAARARDAIARSGVALENAGRYPEALEVFRDVMQLERAAGNMEAAVLQWRRIGRVYLLRQNRYTLAEGAFAEARTLAREHDLVGDEILSTLDLARVDERLGRYDAAVGKARTMRERAREELAAGNLERLDGELLVVDSLLLEGFVEWARAEYFEAFRLSREGLQLAEDLDDEPFRIIAHNNLGLLYWAVNDTTNALAELGHALDLSTQTGLAREAASTHNNRALVYRSLEEFDRAFAELDAAYRIDSQQANRWGVAYVRRNIGLTHLQRGAWREAIDPLREAIAISGDIGDRTNRTKGLVGLGDALREARDAQGARDAYIKALEEARAIPVPEVEWRALHGLGSLARRDGDVVEAHARFAAAIEVIEGLRTRIRIEEFQDGFLLDKQDVYDDMVDLLIGRGEIVEAYNYSERSRARNFIDLLGNARVQGNSAADRADLERESELRSQLEAARTALGAASAQERPAREAEVEELTRQYSNFLVDLRARNPQLSSFVSVETLGMERLQDLLDSGTALVQYHVLPGSLAVWVIYREGVQFARINVERRVLAERIRAFRAEMQSFGRIDEPLAALSRDLWSEVGALMPEGIERLAIVPHRELHLVPFASLRHGGAHLVDGYAIYHAPSASVLEYTMGRRRDASEEPRVLALGNPDRGDPAMDLPFAQKEATRIAWSFPQAEVRTGIQASEGWLMENIGAFDIVHLAMHGEYDPALPLMSSLMLAPDGENDGNLTAQDVFSLSLNTDLVALSACQTGLGRLSNGDDVIGLNRSFVYAGTRQILSSLWRVDDVSTAVLVKHFYRNADEADRAEALRRAMLEVRERYPHPAHWSGMFLTGDWM